MCMLIYHQSFSYTIDHHVGKLQMTADKCFLPFLSLFLCILTSGLLPGWWYMPGKFAVFCFLLVKKPVLSYLLYVLLSSVYFTIFFLMVGIRVLFLYCHHYYYIIEIIDHSTMVCVSYSVRTSWQPWSCIMFYVCVCVYVCVCYITKKFYFMCSQEANFLVYFWHSRTRNSIACCM